jgi:uncharacterized protein (TIGR03492 family)
VRVLVISNGYGEDAMAAILARELSNHVDLVEALPTVGAGKSYEGVCETVGPRGKLASEGHRKVGSLFKDFQHGLALTAVKHVKFMRDNRGRWDKVVTVGDIIGPLLAFAGGHKVDLHLDVYNSGYARQYSVAEKQALKRCVCKVLCRDDILAGSLRALNIDAGFAGNLMMDTVPELDLDIASLMTGKIAITLLPGSREHAPKLFAVEMEAINRLSQKHPLILFVPVAQGVDVGTLIQKAGLRNLIDQNLLGEQHLAIAATFDQTEVHFFEKGIGTLARQSRVVVGQAGTAGFQSAGLGIPVIALVPEDARPQRVRRNERLMGESRITSPVDANQIANKLEPLLKDAKEAERRGKIGIERMGPPGALDAAVRIIAGSAN